MPTTAWTFLAITIAAIGGCPRPLPAQNIADKPMLKAGDLWVFHQTGTETGKRVDRQWSLRIAGTLADGMVRVTPKHGGTDVYDGSWNPRHPDHPESWGHDFEFPLRVGAEWTFESPIGAVDASGLFYRQHGHHKVVAFEPITVPAGTFNCFRLEGASYWTSGASRSHQTYTNTEMWRMTRWYCPEVKYLAKLHVEYSAAGAFIGVVGSTLDSELIRFAPRCESPRPGSRAGTRASRFDGEWTAMRSCAAFDESPAYVDHWRADFEGGQITVEFGTRDRPGYACIAGRAAETGELALDGFVIAGARAYRGQEFAVSFEGKLEGEAFVLNGKFGGRKCSLKLTRPGTR